MAIRSRNIDTSAEFAQQIIGLPVNVGASVNGLIVEARMPWAGRIQSAHFVCSALTDADDSVRVKVQKNGTDLVAAAVDPVAAGTTTSFTLTSSTFAAGDRLQGHVLTGTGDAMIGTFTFVVRPHLGAEERTQAGLA
jgi:hypothetical protein